jgi:hypothetical protein
MKQYIKLAVLALGLGLSFSACQKDYDATPDIVKDPALNPMKGTFECMVNDDKFIAEGNTASLVEVDGIKTLTIQGTKYADNKKPGVLQQVVLTFPDFKETGRFTTGSGKVIITFINAGEGGSRTIYTSTMDEVSFAEIAGTYKGTFSCVVVNAQNSSDRIVISEGKFNFE